MKGLEYEARVRALKLPNLNTRFRGDTIEVYKILNKLWPYYYQFSNDMTRGHNFKYNKI